MLRSSANARPEGGRLLRLRAGGWTNTYPVGIDYAPTASRCGNAVVSRHRAPASRFARFLAGVPNLNRRQTIRVGRGVAYAQVGTVGFDGPIDLQALRLYGLPEAASAVLNGTPLLSGTLSGSGRREFAAKASWNLPSLAAGATALLDVTITGARAGDLAQASLATSSRFFELDATAWSNNTVRVLARNVSNTTIDLGAATLSVQVTKRRVP